MAAGWLRSVQRLDIACEEREVLVAVGLAWWLVSDQGLVFRFYLSALRR